MLATQYLKNLTENDIRHVIKHLKQEVNQIV